MELQLDLDVKLTGTSEELLGIWKTPIGYNPYLSVDDSWWGNSLLASDFVKEVHDLLFLAMSVKFP